MPIKNPEIDILLRIMSKKDWEEAVLEKLDHRPLGIGDLSREFGFEKDTKEYKELTSLVSSLQESRWGGKPKIKTAFTREAHAYPLYRVEQEKELYQKGNLSEECCFDLHGIARELAD